MPAALPTLLYRAAQVRELERIAAAEYGISGATLMERAGRAAWDCFREAWPEAESIAVVCGGGNNGGDGYLFAQWAARHGRKVRVVSVTSTDALRGDARVAAEELGNRGVTPQPLSDSVLDASDVIVDAVFGIGLDRDVSGAGREAIEAMNASGRPILAIDTPSGLHADSGVVMGAAVRASVTVTFLALKSGLYTGAGPDCTGRIRFSNLDMPVGAYDKVAPASERIDLDSVRALLPRRRRNAHKGDFGHVLVIGGDHGYAGAVRMAGEAAARVGSGLVSIATRPEHAAAITAARPELMARGVGSAADLLPLLERATVIAIGPGMGQGDWASVLLARVLDSGLPLVVDADALNLLARDPCCRGNWIITPHPGEAARLLVSSSTAVQADRFAASSELQDRYGGVVVLKGCGTVIADEAGKLAVCSQGNPGMASGGMGDVLTGIIAGLLAQELPPAAAARAGVCMHAAAADACAAGGERGMLASDLMHQLRRLANPGC